VASSEVHWNRTKEYYDVSWRGTWEGEGGGVILSHAIHSHDLLSFIFGDIKSVSANLATLVNNIETEDSASITMTTESKALISSSITLGAANNTSRLKFIFSNVTAESGDNPYAPGEGKWIFTSRDPVKQNELNEVIDLYQKKITPDQDGFRSFFEEIANHLNGKKFNIIEAWEGLKSIELAAAIYYSSMSETKIFLPLDRSNLVYKDWKPK
jgi:predicted dehydrogenase